MYEYLSEVFNWEWICNCLINRKTFRKKLFMSVRPKYFMHNQTSGCEDYLQLLKIYLGLNII